MSWLRGRSRWSVMIAAGSAFAILSGPAAAAPLPSCEDAVPGELYVSHQENASDTDPDTDPDAGTCQHPFRTIAYGLSQLDPGETLNLRGGVYRKVEVRKTFGTAKRPIIIRSYPGELASIDASLPRFRTLAAQRWTPVAGSHKREFVSARHNTPVNQGAFATGAATSA